MNILALYRTNSACDYHRIGVPMKYLKREEKDTYLFAHGPATNTISAKKDLQDQHIIFFNRVPDYEWTDLMRHKKTYGYELVMDLDDHWDLYTNHINGSQWEQTNMSGRLKKCMQDSDVVLTTNDRLADAIRTINTKVVVIPNAFPFGTGQFVPDPTAKSEKISFIHAGGTSHYYDLKSIEGLWTRSKSEVDIRSKAEFVLGGYKPEVNYWHSAYNLMGNSGIMVTRKAHPLENYMNIYNGCHVSLAPLENKKFNTFKSTIKILEAGCKKMPIICSAIYPYLEDEQMDGKGLILCRNVSEWIEAIKFFINNPDKIVEFGEALYDYVIKKYNLVDANNTRYSLFKEIIS